MAERRHVLWAWVLLGPILLSSCQPAAEQAWPNRPITLVVPWKAGGGTDTASRALAAVLQDELGQSINVVNRTGGGGIVGHLALQQARPDGYTLGAITVEITMAHWTGITPLTYSRYTPLALVTINPSAITVRSDAPWQSIDDLVRDIGASPGTILASGTARGGIWDLCRIGFLQAAGLDEADMPWVPSQGAAPALQELLAGGVQVVTTALAETNALRQAGRVRALAVMSEERLPMAPDVPTLKELGIDYASAGGWMVLGAPPNLPEPIQQQLRAAIRRAVVNPAFRDPLERAGFQLRHLTGVPLDTFLEEQDFNNGLLMERAGLVSP